MTTKTEALEHLRKDDLVAVATQLDLDLSGTKDERYLEHFEGDEAARLRRRIEEPSIWDAYLSLLERHDLSVADDEQTLRAVILIVKEMDKHPLYTFRSRIR